MAGKRGRGQPSEEGSPPPAPPLFLSPSLRLFGRLGEGPCRREAGDAVSKERGSEGRRSGTGWGRAGCRAAAGPGGNLARVPGGGPGGQGPLPGDESDSRVPSPGPRETPWKKLQCPGLVGLWAACCGSPVPGVPISDLPRGDVPAGPRCASQVDLVSLPLRAWAPPRKLLQSSQAALGCGWGLAPDPKGTRNRDVKLTSRGDWLCVQFQYPLLPDIWL